MVSHIYRLFFFCLKLSPWIFVYEFMLLAVINSQKLEQQYAVIASFGNGTGKQHGCSRLNGKESTERRSMLHIQSKPRA